MSELYAAAIGVSCIDEYYDTDEWIPEGEKGIVRYKGSMVGGMIPNAAGVLAALGIKTYMVTALNGSSASQLIRSELEKNGLDLTYAVCDPALADPKCIIINTTKERSILVVDTSSVHYPVSPEMKEMLLGAACVYTSMMEFHRLENWEALADELSVKGVKLIFDCETSTFKGPEDELFRYASILFFNEEGWKKYCAGKSDEEACAQLLSGRVEAVVITLGADGCYVRTREQEVRLPGNKVEVVSTNGAGDTFNCTFTGCMIMGKSVDYAAEMANAAGAYAVTVPGVHEAVGSWNVMEERMLEFRKRRS